MFNIELTTTHECDTTIIKRKGYYWPSFWLREGRHLDRRVAGRISRRVGDWCSRKVFFFARAFAARGIVSLELDEPLDSYL